MQLLQNFEIVSGAQALSNFDSFNGELAEWSNAAVKKTVERKSPGVRIPHSPHLKKPLVGLFYYN